MRRARLESAAAAVLVTLGMLAAMPSALAASGWVDVPLPEGARVQWVSSDMRYNGLQMQAYRVRLQQPLAEVLDFYRRRRGDKLVENRIGKKTVLGYMQGSHFVTVELSALAGRTEGQIGIMKMPARQPRPAGQGFEKPGDTRVYEEIVYRDIAGHPATLRMGNRLSPYQNQQFYRRKYLREGYADASAGARCSVSSETCVAHYQKGDRQASVTTIRNERETMVMVIRKD
ncbi:hypothetical protein [Luteimonas sp. e5]